MAIPSEDDYVRVTDDAPSEYHPSKYGAVVSVAKCEADLTQKSTGVPIGDFVVWVGVDLGDGVDLKVIPVEWLEVVDRIP